MRILLAILINVWAWFAANYFESASREFASAGTAMRAIESVGGRTLEEAYYKQVGGAASGASLLCRGLAASITMIGFAAGFILVYGPASKQKDRALPPEPSSGSTQPEVSSPAESPARASDSPIETAQVQGTPPVPLEKPEVPIAIVSEPKLYRIEMSDGWSAPMTKEQIEKLLDRRLIDLGYAAIEEGKPDRKLIVSEIM